MSEFEEVIEALEELKEEYQMPKSVKEKVDSVISMLGTDDEVNTKTSKALTELEDMTNNVNLDSMTRTQLYTVVSILETI